MPTTALSCPQCGGVLPKTARWMLVTCPQCGASVSANKHLVRRAKFTLAYERARANAGNFIDSDDYVKIGHRTVRLIARLGRGEHDDVFLGQTEGLFPERLTVKISQLADATHNTKRALSALAALQVSTHETAPFFTTRIAQVVASGTNPLGRMSGRGVVLLRHPPDYWGSLDHVLAHHATGIDARHVVWMWTRCLDLIDFVHGSGWVHAALSLDHLLVHPHVHAITLIGWSRAEATAQHAVMRVRDFTQLAWSMRRLVSITDHHDDEGHPPLRDDVPKPLAELLIRSSEDHAWLMRCDAADISAALMHAAAASYGRRKFLVFNPRAAAPV